jgi:hypothetical protein
MPTTSTTSTGPVESQASTNDRRLAEERLGRFLESVRDMGKFIEQRRTTSGDKGRGPAPAEEPPK